ncbi:MAG: hypothetical protein ACTS4W_01845 [Candidatus Hodgkinia cicadicola]
MTKRSIDHSSRSKSTDRTSSPSHLFRTWEEECLTIVTYVRSLSFEKNPFERLINLTNFQRRTPASALSNTASHLRTRHMLTIFNHFRRSAVPFNSAEVIPLIVQVLRSFPTSE